MPFSIDDPNILRSIIMDNYQNPRNKVEINDSKYLTIHMDSASCIDDIYIQVLLQGDIIKDVKWHGEGCTISQASTSIMSQLVIGKTIKEALNIKDEFDNMLKGQNFNEEELGDAICFKNVNKQPSRITCADISWRGLQKAINEKK